MSDRSFLRTRPHGDEASVVALVGEFDLFHAGEFRSALLEAGAEGRPLVIVDLTETTFLDSTSPGVLAGAVKRMRQRGGTLVVVTEDRSVTRLFEITGLDRLIPVAARVDLAASL